MSINNRKKHEPRKENKDGAGIWIYGKHASSAVLSNPERVISRICFTKNTAPEIYIPEGMKVFPEVVEQKYLDLLFPNQTHQGVAIQVKALPELEVEDVFPKNFKNEERKSLVIILDQVTDPQNVGAIMRSAAAFGADAVIMPKDNSPKETTALAKAASGALEVLPLVKVTNLATAMQYLKELGFWIIGMDGKAKEFLSEIEPSKKTAIVMGAEGVGMRRLTEENCDFIAKLPISNKVESLNVASAAAIALYEIGSKVK